MSSMSSAKMGAEGNTNPSAKQIAPSKRWIFVLNNYGEDDISAIVPVLKAEGQYIFQEETGKSGTPHLQGYIEFKRKLRPLSLKLNPAIHWEKARGTRQQNIDYCSKSETRTGKQYTNMKLPKPIKTLTSLYPWQQELIDILKQDPDDRTIYWYFEQTGNVGKSAIAKYICIHMNAIILSGKSTDMKYGIMKYMEKHDGLAPDIIIIDTPRHSAGFISYTGIEEIKNGCFFSSKYESDMCIFNSPHVVVFSNQEPDYDKMSADRWIVKQL